MAPSSKKQISRPRLSVTMIVRDEQDVVAGSLQSVRAIADELLVVDTGSTDRTRQVAADQGAKVLSLTWQDDFSAARNFALEHASGDWILILDAGEQLSADAARELRAFIDEQSDSSKAYLLSVQTPPEGSNLFGEQISQIRLMPSGRGLKYTGRVREDVRASLVAAELSLEALPWTIHRGPREHEQAVRMRRARRNMALAQREVAEHGDDARLLCVQGEALARMENTDAAADCYRRALALCPRGSTEMLEVYYGLLTTFDGDVSQRQQQLAVCLEALAVFPLDAQLLCAMGSYLQAEGRLDLAARSYQMAVEFGQINPETWHLSGIAEVAAVCWSLSLQLLERDVEAQQVLEDAVKRHGASPRLRRHLINLYVKYDRRQEALAQVNLLPPDTPHREALRSAVRGACLAAKQIWIPALSYLRTAYTAGCRDPLCLRWLCVALISSGDNAAAEPVLHEWRSQEPGNPEMLKYLEVIVAQQPAGIAAQSASGRSLRVDADHRDTAPDFTHPSAIPAMPFNPARP